MTSTLTKLDIRKLTARIGAEVTGLDPALRLDPPAAAAIREALNVHKALVFRGVSLDDEDQQRFAGYFGPLTAAHPTVPAADGTPDVLPVDSDDGRVIFVSVKYETAHPVVRAHPLTGERGLFIGGFAQRIVGLSAGESRDVLRLLQCYVTRPENVLRVTWQPGQLVLFDNRITQHYAVDNYDGLPRRLHRVTVAGDVPAGVDGRPSYSVRGDASHYTPVAAAASAER
jgi:taurine dioxygenase